MKPPTVVICDLPLAKEAIETQNLRCLQRMNSNKQPRNIYKVEKMETDASSLLTIELFLLTVRLFYLRWGTVSKKDQTYFPDVGKP